MKGSSGKLEMKVAHWYFLRWIGASGAFAGSIGLASAAKAGEDYPIDFQGSMQNLRKT
jgi:hypothetical protein